MNVLCFLAIATLCLNPVAVSLSPVTIEVSSPPAQTYADSAFSQGYDLGYTLGLHQGELDRSHQLDYDPTILGIGDILEGETDQRAIAGYKAGFLAGFHDGFYNHANLTSNEVEEFEDGYNRGYQMGLKEGRSAQTQGLEYQPNPPSSVVWLPQYLSGYLVGYWQGFEQGWENP
ncbi:hypothetical protein K4A83_09810 [Spirulina subsalsa FACHB-351]|uniref:Uncharacterized protein n=1 Tax=Spirulina subsalsa FACHB-351 TaxID=234711 RepID=A0ABT3L4Z7_9CYAN|nr:hypothetical protein [Spirulina subsalsa]MCW6036555.1 hypothetical protein [Spirulina subsalsa FACHB-351]